MQHNPKVLQQVNYWIFLCGIITFRNIPDF